MLLRLQSNAGKLDCRCPLCREVLYKPTPSAPNCPNRERPRLLLITAPLRGELAPPLHEPAPLRRPGRIPPEPALPPNFPARPPRFPLAIRRDPPRVMNQQATVYGAPSADLPLQRLANLNSATHMLDNDPQFSGADSWPITTQHTTLATQPVDDISGIKTIPSQSDSHSKGFHDDKSHSNLSAGGRFYIRTRLGARRPLTGEQRNNPHYTRLFGDQGGWTEMQRPAVVPQVAGRATQGLRTGAGIADRDEVDDEAARRADDEETERIQRIIVRGMAEDRAAWRASFIDFLIEVREILEARENRRREEEDIFEDALEYHHAM
jgi:hypothetical protein